jgi:hypothetical protein
MENLTPEPLTKRAEQLATRLVGIASGNSGATCVLAFSLALLYVLEDPSAPARPAIMDDLAALCQRLVAEAVAFEEEDARFFAKKWIEHERATLKRPPRAGG